MGYPLGDSRAHLLGRFVGEGDRQNPPGRDRLMRNQMSHPTGDCAGFTRTRAGQNQQRPIEMGSRIALLWIESVEDG
jgi:hypothetical protein